MRIPEVGKRIRQIRQRLGLTQAQFAQRLGVIKVSVARYEAGRVPRPKVLEEIARLGGETVIALLEGRALMINRLPRRYRNQYKERIRESLSKLERDLIEYQVVLEVTNERRRG